MPSAAQEPEPWTDPEDQDRHELSLPEEVTLRIAASLRDGALRLHKLETVPQAIEAADGAALVQELSKRMRLGEDIQIQAAEYKIRCDRKLGQLLPPPSKARGGRPRKNRVSEIPGSSPSTPRPPSLSKQRAKTCRSVAEIDDQTFETLIESARREDRCPTAAEAVRLARRTKLEALSTARATPDGPATDSGPDRLFDVLVLDRDWWESSEGFVVASCLPVEGDAHAFIRVPREHLGRLFRILPKWRLKYRTFSVVVATPDEEGSSEAVGEVYVYARRGEARFLHCDDPPLILRAQPDGAPLDALLEFVRAETSGIRALTSDRSVPMEGFARWELDLPRKCRQEGRLNG